MKRANYQIYYMEFQKLYQMPVFYVLVLMSIAFNIYIFWDTKGYQLKEIQTNIRNMKEQPETYEEEYGYDYYDGLEYDTIADYAKREKQFDVFSESLIHKNYEILSQRVKEMSEEERNSISFTGANKLHIFLFGIFMKALIVEGILLIVVTVLYSMHFEEYRQTEELVLVSKVGDHIYHVKLLVAGLFALLLTAIVMIISLLVYFCLIDYSSVWDSFVSSNYNAERRVVNDLRLVFYPFVTWVPMTIREYFFSVLAIIGLIFIFTILISGFFARCQKNSIVALAVIGTLSTILYFMGNEIVVPNMLDYVLKCNPVHLITKMGYWFMDYAAGDSYPAYEIVTMLIWNGAAITAYRKKGFHNL